MLNSPIIGISPMDGYTNIAMRLITFKYNKLINIGFTEFANVEGIFKAPEVSLKLLYTSSKEYKNNRKVIAQVFGNSKQLEYFTKASALIKFLGFSGIDLNTGCPYRNIISSKAGSFLIGKKKMLKNIINAIYKGIENCQYIIKQQPFIKQYIIPQTKILPIWDTASISNCNKNDFSISIKTRLGCKRLANPHWWSFLDKLNVNFITIHARTVIQGYSGTAKWEKLLYIKKHFRTTPIIGNGDIKNKNDIQDKLKITPAGVLIGRGLIGNPTLITNKTLQDSLNLLKEHLHLAIIYFPELKNYIAPFKKFVPGYLSNIPYSKKLKQRLLSAKDYKEFVSYLTSQ